MIGKLAKAIVVVVVFAVMLGVGALAALRVTAALRETAVAADIAPKAGRMVATSAGQIYVVEDGPAGRVPLLLFHGTAGWSALWAATQTALAAKGFRSIAFDIPPFGFSERPADGAYDRTAQAARVVALLDALGIDRAVLVGHSYGGGPAVETVLRAPGRVAGLVLVDAALGLDPAAATDPPAVLTVPFLREVLIAATVTNPLVTRTLLATLLARKAAATDAVARMLQLPLTIRGTTPAIGRWAETFMGLDRAALSSRRESYGVIAVPTAIVWGDADTVTPPEQGRALAALIPGARLEIIPGLGHIPHLEDPALAIPAIVRAVERVSPPAGGGGNGT